MMDSSDLTGTHNRNSSRVTFFLNLRNRVLFTELGQTTKSPKLKKKLKRKRKRKKKQKICHAQGVWKHSAGFDDWCNLNCNHRPAYCPKSHCKCD